MLTWSRFLQNLRTAILTRSASCVPLRRSAWIAWSFLAGARWNALSANIVSIICESETTKAWGIGFSNRFHRTPMRPPFNVASDSVGYFVTIIVRRLEQNVRMLPSNISLCGVLSTGSTGGPRESPGTADAARVHLGQVRTSTSTHFLHRTGSGG